MTPYESISSALEDARCLILTPSRQLRADIDVWALDADLQLAARPATHFIDDWMQALWDRLAADGREIALDRRLLDVGEERVIWERIIIADREALLRPGEMAALAVKAHRALLEWCDEDEEEKIKNLFVAEEEEAFARWREHFKRECDEHGWLSRSALARELRKACERDELPRAARMLLVNFAELPSTKRALLEAATEKLQECELPLHEDASRRLLGCRNIEEELRAASCWAKRRFAQNPEANLALAVADLNRHRELVERVWREILAPGGILPDSPDAEGDFAIGAGVVLAQAPIIAAALRALEWLVAGLPSAEFVALLHTPFIACFDDARAEDKAVLRQLADEWRGERLSAEGIKGKATRMPKLRAALDAAASRLKASGDSAEWRDAFDACLTALGYPGARELNSREHRQHLRWRRLLEDFGAGAEIHGRLKPRQALARLRQLCESARFQPEIRSRQLTALEPAAAAALRFDGLWLIGCEARVWPSVIAANPLLPNALQRDKKMPGGDPKRDFELGRRLTRNLAGVAGEFVASYSSDDERPMPSALIADIATASDEPEGEDDGMRVWRRALIDSSRREEMSDRSFAVNIDSERQGGGSLLADQSACAFRAFARHRLKAGDGLIERGFGLDAKERGILIHAVLRALWSKLGDGAALAQSEGSALKALIDEAVGEEIEKLKSEHRKLGAEPQPNFWSLESERLALLILRCLEVEKAATGPNYKPRFLEEEVTLDLDDLHLSLRVDRVDDLGEEGARILDYKSGSGQAQKFKVWQGERPSDPQLPIYALALADAKLHSLGWMAINDRALREQRAWIVADAPLESLDWEGQRRIWRQALEALAREYLRGEARVAPRDREACRNCPYDALCRVSP